MGQMYRTSRLFHVLRPFQYWLRRLLAVVRGVPRRMEAHESVTDTLATGNHHRNRKYLRPLVRCYVDRGKESRLPRSLPSEVRKSRSESPWLQRSRGPSAEGDIGRCGG